MIFIFIRPVLASEECTNKNDLKIGLLKNDFIDYKHYLYYEIGNYAKDNNIEFEIRIVNNDIDNFDIIFGEFNQLKKLSTKELQLPDKIKKFYEENGIEIKHNILPLDLDTFVLLSNDIYSIKNLEEFSNIYSPIKYTFGMNFNNNEDLLKLILFTNHQQPIKLESHTIESTLSFFTNLYSNSNKNILDANFVELYNSHESKENLFTLFSDGVLLYKNLQDAYFYIFPQKNYNWNKELGIFNNISNPIPYSYFGFSAFINNTNQIGLLCHFTKKDVRYNTFRNFNLQISPMSINELKNFENLPLGYEKIVNSKNKNIVDASQFTLDQIDLIRSVIFGTKNFRDLIESNNYLN